jgi:type IV pilus assembly protein PilM
LKVGEEVAATLRAKLRELGVRTRRVHVGIPRRLAVVKAIELPAVAGADLRRMVGFELERHLPFAAADAIFDFHVLDQAEGHPVRVLLVAVERRVFERVQQLLRDAGLVPRLVDVTIHRLARLAAQDLGAQSLEGRVVVHLEDAEAELAIVRGGRPILSRASPCRRTPASAGRSWRRSCAGASKRSRPTTATRWPTRPSPAPPSCRRPTGRSFRSRPG